MISYLSGFFLSTIAPQMIAEIINIPPYAAYTLPKFAGCKVGITIEKNNINPPSYPKDNAFFSLNHSQTK